LSKNTSGPEFHVTDEQLEKFKSRLVPVLIHHSFNSFTRIPSRPDIYHQLTEQQTLHK